MNYLLTNEAKSDLIRIFQYGAREFGEVQAEKYYNNFFNKFDKISERPFSFEPVDYIKPGFRRCVCGVDSIYFKIENNSVIIVTIIGRQDFK